jgi:hypothetical protein
MRDYCPVFQAMTISALLCAPVLAYAQTPTAAAPSTPPPGKSSVKVDMVPSLFVMNAHGATLQGQTLTLAGVSPTSIVFADRPVRAAGHVPTEALLEEWTTGDFAKDAPNAVREDYSVNGDAWNYFSYDQARSRAYHWREDGLAGISDDKQRLCFALALWNGKDPILKERDHLPFCEYFHGDNCAPRNLAANDLLLHQR